MLINAGVSASSLVQGFHRDTRPERISVWPTVNIDYTKPWYKAFSGGAQVEGSASSPVRISIRGGTATGGLGKILAAGPGQPGSGDSTQVNSYQVDARHLWSYWRTLLDLQGTPGSGVLAADNSDKPSRV